MFNWISSKFHTCIASIKLSFKFEYELYQKNDNSDSRQNGHGLFVCTCVRCCGHSVIFNRISSKFKIRIASIKLLFKCGYGFCQTNDYQDGQQNGGHLTVCTCEHCGGHSNSVIFNWISSKFHTSLLLSNYRSSWNTSYIRSTITKMADKMAMAYQFALVYGVVVTQSFLIIFLPNSKYGLLPSNFH